MKYVYLLHSISNPGKRYVGITENLQQRITEHNSGKCPHTSQIGPWELCVAVQFADVRKANAFERYLKDGSGRAFAKRHFW